MAERAPGTSNYDVISPIVKRGKGDQNNPGARAKVPTVVVSKKCGWASSGAKKDPTKGASVRD